MAKKWSEDPKYFVSSSWHVYSVDNLDSEPLIMVHEKDEIFDKPKTEEFATFMSDNNVRINCEGRAILLVRMRSTEEEYLCLIQKPFSLTPYGLTNKPLTTGEGTVLQSLVTELQQNMVDWSSEQRGQTLNAISGDPKYVSCSIPPPPPSISSIPVENVYFEKDRVLGGGALNDAVGDFMGFLRRMNRTFVNRDGKYVKFEFTAVKLKGAQGPHGNNVQYYDKDWYTFDPFSKVQFNANETPSHVLEKEVLLPKPEELKFYGNSPAEWIVRHPVDRKCAFVYKDYGFFGTLKSVITGLAFRHNAVVTVFFEQTSLGQHCYVDAQATTYFVIDPSKVEWRSNENKVDPRILD